MDYPNQGYGGKDFPDPYGESGKDIVQDMPTRKPFYKTYWFWACVAVVAFILVLASIKAPSSVEQIDQLCNSKYQLADNQQRCKIQGYIALRENM